jgi:CRP-like cAMP-binding protein
MIEADKLRSLPLFNILPEDERAAIAEYVDAVDVPSGERLISEGDFAYEFFVVEHGQAQVTVEGERVGTLGPGDFFGEVGLMLTGRRTATVTALSPMTLVTMFEQNFRKLEQQYPEVARRLREAVKDRFPIRAR